MLIVVGVICFVLATAIGAWRQSCAMYETHLPYNCPSAWMNTAFRFSTWIITALLAIIYAYIFSSIIIQEVGDLIGKFSFGIFLVARWFASSLFGGMPAYRKCQEVLDRYTEKNVLEEKN